MVQLPRMRRGTKPYEEQVEKTRALVHERVQHFASQYGVAYGRIAIRKQKTRWGSCSREGNLNFNYRIGFLPEELADYIIVHELCHIRYFHHGKEFWTDVAKTIPEWKEYRKRLQSYRF